VPLPKSDAEKTEAVNAVLVYLRLCPFTHDIGDVGLRWSRTTLYLTQGWLLTDRCWVWAQVLYRDTATDKPSSSPVSNGRVTENMFRELEERIARFGNDGGLTPITSSESETVHQG